MWAAVLVHNDVELPDASGTDIALKLGALYPDLPVLVISGKSDGLVGEQGRIELQPIPAEQGGLSSRPDVWVQR